MEKVDIFAADHLELVDGELISKMGKTRSHVNALRRVLVLLMRIFGDDLVDPAAPLDVASADNLTNEPEPDVIVRRRDSGQGNPSPSDLMPANIS